MDQEKESLKDNILGGNDLFNFKFESKIEFIEFVKWFIDNGTFYNQLLSQIPKDIIVSNATAGNCFHNSQLLCINNVGQIYCEGVYIFEDDSMYHHGFNLIANDVLDVTYIKNYNTNLEYMESLNNKKVIKYFGIIINKEVFIDNKEIETKKYLDNHLLYSVFKNSKIKKPLD